MISSLLLLLALLSPEARSEGYVGIVNAKPAADAPAAPTEKDTQEKVKKTDAWVKNAYAKLNDGRQEKYTEEVDRKLKDMVRDIYRGGTGHVHGEMPKFIEHKLELDPEDM